MMPPDAADGRPPIIVGAGFTGLAAAYELAKAGHRPLVLEADDQVGGLAGGFPVGQAVLEKFYHHWFTNDLHIIGLIDELGLADRVVHRPTRTGMYYANRFHRLSSPLDVLRFKPLGMIDRLRLARLVLRARKVKDWRRLESLTAEQWLRQIGGERVYRVVWEPLLRGKFGPYAEQVSAVWMWNKLKLRGGSRGQGGREVLAYFEGGFLALAEALRDRIEALGGEVRLGTRVEALAAGDGRIRAVQTSRGEVPCSRVLLTPALPIVAEWLKPLVDDAYLRQLESIDYLANTCVVLELDRSLSSTYWLNVNDPSFPFVAVIEHTNFEPPAGYGGRHIVYLSKYLPHDHALYQMSDQDFPAFCEPHLRRMFPDFSWAWVKAYHVWRARYAQPIVDRHYSAKIPPFETPVRGVYLSTMAQIYPEDRGTNYAVREGRNAGRAIDMILNG